MMKGEERERQDDVEGGEMGLWIEDKEGLSVLNIEEDTSSIEGEMQGDVRAFKVTKKL